MNGRGKERQLAGVFSMPFQIGVLLAANAVSDSALIIDGQNCIMPKAEFIYGNHDVNSSLFSPEGINRIMYTMSKPLRQKNNAEHKIRAILRMAASSGHYGLIFVTGLPFQALAGVDYEGICSDAGCSVPAVAIPPKSLEYDWLDGYAMSLEAAAENLPCAKDRPKKKNTAILAGFMYDRNEGDCIGNIAEIKRLLDICGISLSCVFPGGCRWADIVNSCDAEYVISLPYGRRAAKIIAEKTGAKLIETDLPIGFSGTFSWIKTVCDAAGLSLPEEIAAESCRAYEKYLKISSVLRHKTAVFAGDPYLFEAVYKFLKEILMRPGLSVLCCQPRKIKNAAPKLLFRPYAAEVHVIAEKMTGYEKPDVVIGNSFVMTEQILPGTPFVELGFPSYSHHCFNDEPFMGFKGAANIVCRLLNSQINCR